MLRLLFILMIFPIVAEAAGFRVQPIERQIRDADGIFMGNYLRSRSIQLEEGKVAIQMIFRMTKEMGLESEMMGLDEIIVHYPGAVSERIPEFTHGEKVILFIRNVDDRYWGMNLGFGSFKVMNYGNEVMMVNSLFPHHPQFGQVNLLHFEKTVKALKGVTLRTVQSNLLPLVEERAARGPASTLEGQSRTVASTAEEDNQEGQQHSNFWLIAFLGLSGGIFRLTNLRPARK